MSATTPNGNEESREEPREAQSRPPASHPVGSRLRNYGPETLLANPAEYFQELTEIGVDEHTVALLTNMFSKEMMLGNITEGDLHEVRWLARNMMDMVIAEHPDPRSTFVGRRRKVLSGDYDNGLRPLSGLQKNWIQMSVFNFIMIVSRSVGGFQQEMNAKQINVLERRESEHESGGLRERIPGVG